MYTLLRYFSNTIIELYISLWCPTYCVANNLQTIKYEFNTQTDCLQNLNSVNIFLWLVEFHICGTPKDILNYHFLLNS